MWVTGAEDCQSGMSENITWIAMTKKTTSIFPHVILISLSQCHLVRAKLLIEFDGASAASWNDIRHHSLLPRGLRLHPCPVLFAHSSLYISITLSGHVNVLWWITEQTVAQTALTQVHPTNVCFIYNCLRRRWDVKHPLAVILEILALGEQRQWTAGCVFFPLFYIYKYTDRVWNHSLIQY